MNVIFHPEADAELHEATRFYDSARHGLGDEFADEVQNRVREIAVNPTTWPVVEGNVRRAPIRRFPYDILFVTEQEQIEILAVMHHHRHPEYWRHRMG